MSIPTLTLLVGPVVPVPVPGDVSDALERVEIETAIGQRGSFRLHFRVQPPSTLPERFLLESGDLLRVVLVLNEGGAASVAMDGVMVVHTLVADNDGKPSLVVSGEDLTLLMDLVEIGRPFSAMPIQARVQTVLASYLAFGIVPVVVPPPALSIPLPSERIPHQVSTDYAYIRSLAGSVGFRFTLDPGPAPASSVAYWGPEPRADRTHPSLVIDFARPTGIEGLRLSFDGNARVLPEALVLDSTSKSVIPLPIPNISALVPPLGAVVPPGHRHRRLRDTAKLTPADGSSEVLAIAARTAEAMTGQGTLDVTRARVRLRAGAIVNIRNSAKPFDGLYEVSRVRDTITSRNHSQAFELLRAGIGATPGGGP